MCNTCIHLASENSSSYQNKEQLENSSTILAQIQENVEAK